MDNPENLAIHLVQTDERSPNCTGSSAEPLDMDNPENLAILKILVQTDERSNLYTIPKTTK